MAIPVKRPGQGKGGFLSGQSGFLRAYSIQAGKAGTTQRGTTYTPISVKLTVQADGSEPVDQYYNAGFLYGNNTVSKDGQTIEGTDLYTGPLPDKDDALTGWAQFLVSLFEGDGNRLPEEMYNPRNFANLMGTRVTFVRVPNEAETKRRGPRVDDNGKEWPRDVLLVQEVLAAPEPVKAGKKAAGKTGTKTAKANGTATTAAIDTDAADEALMTILANGAIERTKINGAAVRYRLSAKDEDGNLKFSQTEGELLRKTLISEDYLAGAAERGLVTVEGDSIALA